MMRKEYASSTPPELLLNETGNRRLALPGLSDAVIGGLAYLYDSHVHQATGYSGSNLDFLISTEKAKRPVPWISSAFRSILGKYIIRERHLQGTWPGYIHFLADMKKLHARPLLVVADYNLFTTASTAYSLLLFDDRQLPEEFHVVGSMLDNASRAIRGFRRDEAYNFWNTHFHARKSYACSGPLNIPVSLVGLRRYFYKHTGFFGLNKFHESERLLSWVLDCFNKRINPSGGAAIFNIPNDADNTSMAAGFQILYHRWLGQPILAEDIKPLECLPLYRDLNRTKTDRYYKILGEDTGAFLTWFKDEHLPPFSYPGRGIIPLYMNNVDIVINANVLFALTLANKQSTPGYHEAVRLIAQVVEQREWSDASLYYPQKYVFPYAVSRVWRDARIHDPLLNAAMSQLMVQILDEMVSSDNRPLVTSDEFPKRVPDDFIHATALILATLLNLGSGMAENCGLAKQFNQVIGRAVRTLLFHCKNDQPRQKDTSRMFPGFTLNFWEPGILYSSSLQQLAHWRSHSQTTALVLEALAKYILAYDLTNGDFQSRRLYLRHENKKWSLSLQPLSEN